MAATRWPAHQISFLDCRHWEGSDLVKIEEAKLARAWIGTRWGESNNSLRGLRLLVLGESHYHRTMPIGSDMPDMTEHVVAQHLKHSQHRFFKRIEGLAARSFSSSSSSDFWHSIVFYNYVPYVAANRPRQRPPEWMWGGAAPALFASVLKEVRPQAVLVCGTELWRRMPVGLGERLDAYQAGGRAWREREYEVELPARAMAAHIPHPSSFGWSYARCLPVMDHLRRRGEECISGGIGNR